MQYLANLESFGEPFMQINRDQIQIHKVQERRSASEEMK